LRLLLRKARGDGLGDYLPQRKRQGKGGKPHLSLKTTPQGEIGEKEGTTPPFLSTHFIQKCIIHAIKDVRTL